MEANTIVTEEEILWQRLKELNRTWTKGNPYDLDKFFHKDMIAIAPGNPEIITGRDKCIAGWAGFMETAVVESFDETDQVIKIFGDTAIVAYNYTTICIFGGNKVELKGRDMFTFIKEAGQWMAVSDQFSPMP